MVGWIIGPRGTDYRYVALEWAISNFMLCSFLSDTSEPSAGLGFELVFVRRELGRELIKPSAHICWVVVCRLKICFEWPIMHRADPIHTETYGKAIHHPHRRAIG